MGNEGTTRRSVAQFLPILHAMTIVMAKGGGALVHGVVASQAPQSETATAKTGEGVRIRGGTEGTVEKARASKSRCCLEPSNDLKMRLEWYPQFRQYQLSQRLRHLV